MVDMSSTLWPVVVYHILALPLTYFLSFLLAWYLVKAPCLPIRGLVVVYSMIRLLVCSFMSSTEKPSSKTGRCSSTLVGGGISNVFTLDDMGSCINMDCSIDPNTKFKFVSHTHQAAASELQNKNPSLIVCNLPLSDLISKLVISDLKSVSKSHDIAIHSN